MSNPVVNVSFGNPDPSATVSDLQSLVTELNSLISGSLNGDFVPYVTSTTTPAVSDQDKIWMQLDAAGRPIAIKKFYSGSWRRFYSGLPSQIRMFTGDPGTYFDGTGLGLVTAEWDGWALCNGQNGTPNLSNQFVVGGQMDNNTITGYSSGWQTNVTGTAVKTGGNADYTIVNNNLPNMKIQLSGRVGYDDNASGSGQDPAAIVTKKWYGATTPAPIPVLASFGADPTGTPVVPQVAIPTTPPFYALAFAAFVGYA